MPNEYQATRGRDTEVLHNTFQQRSTNETDDKILVVAFTNGLRKGKFLFSLYKNDPKTMSDVLYRVIKYMNAVDIVFCPPSICMSKPRKFQKYHFLSMGPWEHLERRGATRLGIGVPGVLFFAKITKMPLVSPRVNQRSNVVRTLTKQRFSQFYIKPELLGDFWQLWPSLNRSHS